MAERKFLIESFVRDRRSYTGPTVECRKCGVKEYYHSLQRSRTQADAAKKSFQRHGWDIGNSPRMDTCPSCKEQKRIYVPPPAKEKRMSDKIVQLPVQAEKPREMSREDRQRVHAKIGEHYLESGYDPPWTDKRIAEDLKVPAAWVVEIRDQFFGEEGSNPLYDRFEKEATAFTDELRRLQVEIDQIKALEAMGQEIAAMLKDIRKEMRK